jgi:hypothetical protein
MGFRIEGASNGVHANVTEDGRLKVNSIIVTEEHHANHVNNSAYNVTFSQSASAVDDCIFYMQNTDSTDMIVEGITLGFKNAGSVDAEIYVKLGNTGTRNSAVDVTPVNLNVGSGKTADGIFQYGPDLNGGVAELTDGSEIERFIFPNVQDLQTNHFNFQQDVILPKNTTLTIWVTDPDATFYVTLPFYYHK